MPNRKGKAAGKATATARFYFFFFSFQGRNPCGERVWEILGSFVNFLGREKYRKKTSCLMNFFSSEFWVGSRYFFWRLLPPSRFALINKLAGKLVIMRSGSQSGSSHSQPLSPPPSAYKKRKKERKARHFYRSSLLVFCLLIR